MSEVKPQVWHVQNDKNFSIGNWRKIWVSKDPLPIDLENKEFGETVQLVSKQAYEKAVSALKKISAYFDCLDCEMSNDMTCSRHLDERMDIAINTLKELGELG